MKIKSTLIIMCFGVLFIIIGIFVLNQSSSLKRRCTQETMGTVVDVIREEDYTHEVKSYKRYTYFPVIEYQTEDGTITQKSKSGQRPPKYTKGEQVQIFYNPNNVQEYIINGDSNLNFIGIIFVVIGIVAVVVSFIGRNSHI